MFVVVSLPEVSLLLNLVGHVLIASNSFSWAARGGIVAKQAEPRPNHNIDFS